MKLFSIKNLAMTGALSVAGLGLIGVGAHAVFTQNTTSTQDITAGTMNVTLSASGASGNGSSAIVFPSVAPVGSSFVDVDTVTITNSGNIPVNEVAIQLTDANNNSTMESEIFACIYGDGNLFANEPLTTIEGYDQAAVLGSIGVGDTDTYTVVFYAGAPDGGCGPDYSGVGGPYGGYPSSYAAAEDYTGSPAFGNNTDPLAVAGLTNPAEGGTVNPTLTFSYTG
jgi:predicted ribosomally synthesized peptide with SipW-like signal peptide